MPLPFPLSVFRSFGNVKEWHLTLARAAEARFLVEFGDP